MRRSLFALLFTAGVCAWHSGGWHALSPSEGRGSSVDAPKPRPSKTLGVPPGPWSVASPDGHVSIEVETKASTGRTPGTNSLYYRVLHDRNEVLPAATLGITLRRLGRVSANLRPVGQSTRTIDERYAMPVGKKSACRNRANELVLDFVNDRGGKMSLIVRAYDDGVAYRYRVDGSGADAVVSEDSSFRIPKGSQGWFARFSNPSYEWRHESHATLAGIDYDIAFPALFHTPGGHWIYVSEAAVDGTYAGARLRFPDAAGELLAIHLPEPPASQLPWLTPWRVAILDKRLAALVESTMIADLNPPSEIADTGWITPGVGVIPWMSEPQTVNSRFERMKQYVDLAAEMGWPWIEFDNALALGNQGADPPEKWMAVPWIPELVKYAGAKGVSVYGWDHWRNLDTPQKREHILGYFVKHGLKGIKVDFLESDSQERFQFRETMARQCARHRLMLSFHGETLPRGQQRRWPNIATLEGVMGQEYYLFSHGPTPAFNVNLVFTRNIAGSMDACPSGFALPGTPFSPRTTSNAHEMALAVLFESGWQCMSVSPESMKDNPAKAFLKHLPSAWDDIHFVDGHPDQFAVLARRKGRDWWLAGINAGTPREVRVPLGFLKPGSYRVKLYRDAPARSTLGLDVSVLNCGGVNAALGWIELWSTAKPAESPAYHKPAAMPDPPKSYHLVAADDCGVPERQPHRLTGLDWKYSLAEIPAAAVPENDPARTISFADTAIRYRFADLEANARYKLRVLYLSHDDRRAQSLLVNDRVLHDKLALPKHKIVCREFDIPAGIIRHLPPEALQTKIAVEDRVVDAPGVLRVALPVNGGFGVKIEGGAGEPGTR
jgi:alpha-glucosidase